MDERRKQALAKIADSLTDGLSPDWDRLASDPDSETHLRALQNLEKIADAFRAQRSADTGSAPAPQFVWKHLEVHEEIGRGGFGQVYRAFDPVLCRDVALKLRRQSDGRQQSSDRMFIVEARSLARVRHPNVLAVYGADRSDGKVGMWADLVPGRTLQQQIEADRALDMATAHAITRKLLLALGAIHDAGLVHGDVKASNIMVQPNGEPVLMDFGSASEVDHQSMTAQAGSPLYLAPERLEGAAASVASDVYALGVLLYKMLSGQYPRQADQFDQLVQAHRDGQAIPMRAIPKPYHGLLQSMLAAQVSDRVSVNDCLAELDDIELRPRRRRRQAAIAVIVGSLLLGLMATTYGIIEARQSEQQARLAQREAEDVTRFMADLLHAPSGHTRGGQTTVAELLDDAVSQLDLLPPENQLRAARFRSALGLTYSALGEHDRAIALLQASLQGFDTVNEQSTERIETLVALGRSLALSGEPKSGRPYLDQAFELAEASAASAQLLAEIQMRRSEVVKAIDGPVAARPLMVDALERVERAQGADSLHGVIEMALADVLLVVGEIEEAERRIRSAYERLRNLHPEHHVNLLSTRETMGLVLTEQGRFDEAYELIALNARVLQEKMPEGSYRLGLTLANLSSVLDNMGRKSEAMDVNQRAIEVLESSLGPRHINTLKALSNHAVRLWKLGRADEAERAYLQAIERASDTLGPEHPLVLINSGNLAELLLETGRFAEAQSLATETVEVDQRVLGETHPYTLFASAILGAALGRSGQLQRAVDVLDGSHRKAAEKFGTDHMITIIAAEYLAEMLYLSGDHARAATLLTHVVSIHSQRLGDDSPETMAAETLLNKVQSR